MALKLLSFVALFSTLVLCRMQVTSIEGPVMPRGAYAFYIDDDTQSPSLSETEVCEVKLCGSKEGSFDDCDIAHLTTIQRPSESNRVEVDLENHLRQDASGG